MIPHCYIRIIVEDHQARQLGHGPRHLRQVGDEGADLFVLVAVAGGQMVGQLRPAQGDQPPGHGRPDQQVHGQHFGEGDQVVVGVGAGEHRLLHPAEEALAQFLVGGVGGQQVFASVVAGRVGVERLAGADRGAVEVFAVQAEALDQAVDGRQHRAGDVVGVDLVAAQHQQRRTFPRLFAAGFEQGVGLQQAVLARVVRLATGAVQQVVEPAAAHEARPCLAGVEQVRRPVGDDQAAAILFYRQIVIDEGVGRQRLVEHHIDQVQPGVAADGQALAAGVVKGQVELDQATLRVVPGQLQAGVEWARADQPEHQAPRFEAAQQRAGEDQGQVGGMSFRQW